MNETIEMRNELLDRLVEEFHDAYIAAAIAENDDPEAPKIVRALLDEVGDSDGVMGEYFFTPMSSEEDPIQVFNAILTLSEDMPEDNLPAFFEAMSYINYHIPVGAFSFNKDHTFFCFKMSVVIPMGYDKDVIYGLMSAVAGNSASIVDLYMEALMDIANNKISVEEVKDMVDIHRE